MSLLFPNSNQASGDAVVTTNVSSIGIQYARSGGLLPASLSVPLFQADVQSTEQIIFDLKFGFSGSIGTSFVFPPDFTLSKILFNGAVFTSLGFNANALATANVALTGLQTIDGVTFTDGMVVQLTGQTTASQNGPWVQHAGAWTRPTFYSNGQHFNGFAVRVLAGTVHANQVWYVANAVSDVIGTNGSTWQILVLSFAPSGISALSLFFTSTETSSAAFFAGSMAVTIP